MSGVISIRPSKDIRTNYAQISELTRKNPVAITVNGKEDTVLMSHEDFIEQQLYVSDLEARLAVYAHLAQSADDLTHCFTHIFLLLTKNSGTVGYSIADLFGFVQRFKSAFHSTEH